MVKTDMEKLSERVSELEDKLKSSKKVKESKESKPREKSKYNIFVQEYIAAEKKKSPNKKHSEMFSEAAKAWTASKKV